MKLTGKTTLYWLTLVVWLGLIASLLVYPLGMKVKSKSDQLKRKQEKIAEVETQSRRLGKLQRVLKKSKADFQKLDQLFIEPEAPVGFLEFLERAAADSDLELNITPSAGEKLNREPWPPTFFEVTGKGSFQNCVEFATKIETAPYLLRIQKLNLEQAEKREAKVNLLIKVY